MPNTASFAKSFAARIEQIANDALVLLKELIRTPSLSGEEDRTAMIISAFLQKHGAESRRLQNNVYSWCSEYNPEKETVLLNSHHDTVPASASWTRSPFEPSEEDGRLYGLGSNDAGGPLVALIAAFLYFQKSDCPLPFNLVLAATAEEETSGTNGVALLLPELGEINLGIVGEPTSLQMAVAEKGLMVLDCVAHGKSGHAAREEGENAIYNAMKDIEWFRTYRFDRESETLGPVKMAVTVVQAGSRHNVVPDECRFTVDVRTTDSYSSEEVLGIIRNHVSADVVPRSLRLSSSGIAPDHPVVLAAQRLGLELYGSPTISDQALMPFPTIKLGPGDSARSHTADEWIGTEQIRNGVRTYIALIETLKDICIERSGSFESAT